MSRGLTLKTFALVNEFHYNKSVHFSSIIYHVPYDMDHRGLDIFYQRERASMEGWNFNESERERERERFRKRRKKRWERPETEDETEDERERETE